MKILVTGGMGLIGHNVVQRLNRLDHLVSIVDNKTNYGIIPQAELDELMLERLCRIKTRNIVVANIEEKPANPKSNLAVAGIYLYPSDVFEVVRTLKPSGRGELEITDVNNHYLHQGRLRSHTLQGFWTDAGTLPSLHVANELVRQKMPVF
jgi:dTDP-glucose pyrophosphorylase